MLNIELRSLIESDSVFVGDEEDLHEMLGNLLENACKWAKAAVTISAAVSDDCLRIEVSDDGPGIPEAVSRAVFRRGARFDETAPGHGHGLAIVHDIAALYGGAVVAGVSSLGGASIRLTLPGAIAPAQG
jgi:signal transduction histidine kinase